MLRSQSRTSITTYFSLVILNLLSVVLATDRVYIKGLGLDGVERDLDVSRTAALYTGDFDDCLGGESLFNITKFDAAYYADNLTVLFHLDGTTNVRSENLMLHLAVEAYGENRFNMTYDPCKDNIYSMCPLNGSVPVTAFAVTPIAPKDVSGIPSIALNLPDLEGLARLRIFANSSQTEIGCFQAVMTNGNTFSQPQSIGSVVGIMVFLAILASFATAIYGVSITHMRTHYAHSFSVLVIFETFQSIFFSGALSVNWPSVLPAWWSNFAWTAGMFANERIIRSVSSFTGNNVNITQVGGAGSVQLNTGGGLLKQIYGRSLSTRSLRQQANHLNTFSRRYNSSNPYDYNWNGRPQTPGMPMPGTWPGFGGTLSITNIPPAQAFIVGLIWLVVVLAAVVCFIVLFKLILDLLIKIKWLKTDGFDYFRSHVWGYTAAALLRTLFISFFTFITLTTYQFTLRGPAGPTVVAVMVWLILLAGLGGLAAYACYFRLRHGKFETRPDTVRFERGTALKKVPFIATTRASTLTQEETAQKPYLFGTLPFLRIKYTDDDPGRATAHQDEGYVKRLGWLSARYRRSRWWFFAFYLGYQFIRACFIGGAVREPLVQVYGLFIFEVFALLAIIKINPFESNRNTAVGVWMLSVSKIVTTGLSIAFLPAFSLNRIAATVLGVIIVVVQGFLAIAVLILIVLGMISTWMSLSRNREQFPGKLEKIRVGYFEHTKSCGEDAPRQSRNERKKGKEAADAAEEQSRANFEVRDVRRAPKLHNVEEEDERNPFADLDPILSIRPGSATPMSRRSRPNSAGSRYSAGSLPRSSRAHRASWSSKDVAIWDSEMNRGDQARYGHSRSSSLRLSSTALESHGANTPVRRPMTPTAETLEEVTPNNMNDIVPDSAVVDSSSYLKEAKLDTGSHIEPEQSKEAEPSHEIAAPLVHNADGTQSSDPPTTKSET